MYTRFGSSIWKWEPFVKLPYDARNLWLALYTSEPAKRIVPGLWEGSIHTMADAAHMLPDETLKALDKLLEHEMVEYDSKMRVLRLTMFPDSGESPANGNVIRGWFKRFIGVPQCPVRDAHVPTLMWLMEQYVRENPGKKISEGHLTAWSETFAHVTVPAPRRRGVRRLVDSSTGTQQQPGLFDAPSPTAETVPDTLPRSSPSADLIHSTLPVTAPRNVLIAGSESNPKHQNETVPHTVPERYRSEPSDQDLDRDLDLSSLGKPPEPPAPQPMSGANGAGDRPRLVLVPAPASMAAPNEVTELLADLCAGMELDVRHTEVREGSLDGLCRTIAQMRTYDASRAEMRLVGRWARSRCVLGQVSGAPTSKVSAWAAIPGMVAAGLRAVREQARRTADVQDQLEAIRKGGAVPT